MRTLFLGILTCLLFIACKRETTTDQPNFPTVFETSKGKKTATYQEVINFYLELAKHFPQINVQTLGNTDSGYPLHLVTFNPDGNFNFNKVREKKNIILINNGIHPGEPDGIDATMLLFRDLGLQKISLPKNVVITTIPVYNVGGMLNRNSTTRTNQNGPEAYGFRGNTRNYDLNRDFIKMDTENAKTFSNIFHLVKPDVFIDNHVSNGADYQYTLTHLFTQHNKLGGALGEYLNETFMPALEQELQKSNIAITPYVNVFNRPPDQGFTQFIDHPRYSTGYTSLWNSLGFMVETHMLKAYQPRVEQTYELLKKTIAITDKDYKQIKEIRQLAFKNQLSTQKFLFNWRVDTTQTSTLNFKGFKADTVTSAITGQPRLKYNADIPFEKAVPYQNYFYPQDTLIVPEAYVIKKGWKNVLDRLIANKITFFEIEKPVELDVECYKIASYQTYSRPYEGHYLHYNTKVINTKKTMVFQKGDIVVPTRQNGFRYILETLEPEAVDSFFNWNFFDTVLQQKEGFSPYVFEDLALFILENNSPLKDSLERKKQLDDTFANNSYAQLDWIHKKSKYYEASHLQYPIYRIPEGSEGVKFLEN